MVCVCLSATTASPTCSTSNHTLTTNKQASPPTQPPSAALRQNVTQKKLVSSNQQRFHKQLLESFTASPIDRAVLLSHSAPHTRAHLMQPSSEAYEAEDRCCCVAVVRRLMLPHPAFADPSGVALSCPNKSVTGQMCGKPVDLQQHHCFGCRYGGCVDRRHAGVARCLADVIHSHTMAPRRTSNRFLLLLVW